MRGDHESIASFSFVVIVFLFLSRETVPFCTAHLMALYACISILLLQMEQYAGQGMYVTLFTCN